MTITSASAKRLAEAVALATSSSRNEATLRHRIEAALHDECARLRLPWYPFQLDARLRGKKRSVRRFVDVAHGAVVIEYEPPKCFRGREGRELEHARAQAAEYAELLAEEEGRALRDYTVVAWDGSHISFGRFEGTEPVWDSVLTFDHQAAATLLQLIADNGRPTVHPLLLAAIAGPDTDFGTALIPALFGAIRRASRRGAPTTKTLLLYTEWRRLFGQVTGAHSDRLRELLHAQGARHDQRYGGDAAAYLFALNTYIALVAKLVAAMSMPNVSEDITDATVPIAARITRLEDGTLFESGGVTNMVAGDFFSWYRDDAGWPTFQPVITDLVRRLAGLDFDTSKKRPEATRDLFKGIYQSFVPSALRHALGEYYTPDWLAEHALDVVGWTPADSLLDPTCGTGTFVLEAMKRRVQHANDGASARELLDGIFGLDLNPLAVLAARASLVVSLAGRLDANDPVVLPIFLADAINPAQESDEVFSHRLQTERGVVEFNVPAPIVRSAEFLEIFNRVRELVNTGRTAAAIHASLSASFRVVGALPPFAATAFRNALESLVLLHANGWDGIWCAVLADRFKAGAISPVSHVVGNPPWVKWSHLPVEYANFIKDRCLQLGVFSEDRWVGGIESDISTVVTYEAIDKWLAPNGTLAFFITGTVFSNESSQGFRRFELQHRHLVCKVLRVEDFGEVRPFEGVTNFPTLLILRRDEPSSYPVPYRVWQVPRGMRGFANSAAFIDKATYRDLLAAPVPGTDAGPWLKGTAEEHQLWSELFGPTSSGYVARKGITTDRNGIYFVRIRGTPTFAEVHQIENEPALGRTKGLPQKRGRAETEHLFPLLRGRGISAFVAEPDPIYHVLLPQRGMHGDADLPDKAPHAHRFLSTFKDELAKRSSLVRFQKGKPYWSVWSTGAYTFAPHKVAWREMSGGRFVAAYVGEVNDPRLGRKVVIPDHKVYFVPADSMNEAAFICGVLNAPSVSRAISAYAAQLSLGVSVIEYLKLPRYDGHNRTHRTLANLSRLLISARRSPSEAELAELDQLALATFRGR